MNVWWRRVGRALFVVALVFVVAAGVDVGRRLFAGQLSLRLSHLAAATVSFAIGYIALCWGFGRFVAHHTAATPPFAIVAEVYFRSLLGRYVPGKVAVPAVRAAASAELGMSSALLAGSAVLETLAWMSTGTLGCALVSLLTGSPRALPGAPSRWLFAAVGVGSSIVLLALCTLDRKRYPQRLLRLARCETGTGPLVPIALVVGAMFYWAFAAACSAAITVAVGGSSHSAGLAVLATMASSLAGFLALPVPAGMGVREAAFAWMLGPSLGSETALAVALVTRAIGIALEALLWVGFLGARWRLHRR